MATGTESATETSYWLKFFTDAHIPAGDAAHYAVLFSDNRIQRGMLLDLTKEYLTDMGVGRLGDVIAILKHAKTVHDQDAKDKALKGAKYTTASGSPLRRSTAASRMVDHFLAKNPDSAPMNQPPTPKSLNTSGGKKSSVFDRLGADSSGNSTGSSSSGVTGAESVFSRLGGQKRPASSTSPGDSDDDSGPQSPLGYHGIFKFTPSAKKTSPSPSPPPTVPRKKVRVTIEESDPPVQITAVEKSKVVGPSKVKVTGLDRVKVSSGGPKGEGFDSSDIQPLKVQVSSTTSTPSAKPKMQRRLGGVSVSVSSSVDDLLQFARMKADQREEVSTTTPPLTRTAGVLSLDASMSSSSIKTRLGQKVLKAPASSTTPGFAPATTTKAAASSDVKSRLGTRTQQGAAATTKLQGTKVLSKMRSEQVQSPPSSNKLVITTATHPAKSKTRTGVFSRLGKKASVS